MGNIFGTGTDTGTGNLTSKSEKEPNVPSVNPSVNVANQNVDSNNGYNQEAGGKAKKPKKKSKKAKKGKGKKK